MCHTTGRGRRGPSPSGARQAPVWTLHSTAAERALPTVHFPREARVGNSLTQRPCSPSYLRATGESVLKPRTKAHTVAPAPPWQGTQGGKAAEPSKPSPHCQEQSAAPTKLLWTLPQDTRLRSLEGLSSPDVKTRRRRSPTPCAV